MQKFGAVANGSYRREKRDPHLAEGQAMKRHTFNNRIGAGMLPLTSCVTAVVVALLAVLAGVAMSSPGIESTPADFDKSSSRAAIASVVRIDHAVVDWDRVPVEPNAPPLSIAAYEQ